MIFPNNNFHKLKLPKIFFKYPHITIDKNCKQSYNEREF